MQSVKSLVLIYHEWSARDPGSGKWQSQACCYWGNTRAIPSLSLSLQRWQQKICPGRESRLYFRDRGRREKRGERKKEKRAEGKQTESEKCMKQTYQCSSKFLFFTSKVLEDQKSTKYATWKPTITWQTHLKGLEWSKAIINGLCNCSFWLTTSIRSHVGPEDGMVQVATSIELDSW